MSTIAADDIHNVIRRAMARCEQKRYASALAELTRALRSQPNSADLHISAGLAYAGNKQFKDALAACDNAVRIAPEYGLAYLCRARVFAALGRAEAFLGDVREGMRLDSSVPVSSLNREMLPFIRSQYEAILDGLQHQNISAAMSAALLSTLATRLQDIVSRIHSEN